MPKGKKAKKAVNKKTNGMYGAEQDYDDELDKDSLFSNSDGYDSDGEVKKAKITLFCKMCHYTSVKEAGKHWLEWHLTKKEKSDWDVAWYDGPVNIQFIKEMKKYQRVNHFPGIYNLARKNMLGRHLMRM